MTFYFDLKTKKAAKINFEVLALLLLLSGSVLHKVSLIALNPFQLVHDHALFFSIVEKLLYSPSEGIKLISYTAHPPLFFIINIILLPLLGKIQSFILLINVIFWAISVWIGCSIVRRYSDHTFSAIIFLALMVFHSLVTQQVYEYRSYTLIFLFQLFLLKTFIEEEKPGSKMYVLTATLLCLTHYLGFLVCFAFFTTGLINGERNRSWLIKHFLIILPALLWMISSSFLKSGSAETYIQSSFTPLAQSPEKLIQLINGRIFIGFWANLPAVLLLVSIAASIKKMSKISYIAISLFIISIVFNCLGLYPITFRRWSIFLLPYSFILISCSNFFLQNKNSVKIAQLVILCLMTHSWLVNGGHQRQLQASSLNMYSNDSRKSIKYIEKLNAESVYINVAFRSYPENAYSNKLKTHISKGIWSNPKKSKEEIAREKIVKQFYRDLNHNSCSCFFDFKAIVNDYSKKYDCKHKEEFKYLAVCCNSFCH